MASTNPAVTQFLDDQEHPLRSVIEALRHLIIGSTETVEENIKWNGPNYTVSGRDVLTMKIFPPKQIQLVFHQGATTKSKSKEPILKDASGILTWKDGNRAIISFKAQNELKHVEIQLVQLIQEWVKIAIQ